MVDYRLKEAEGTTLLQNYRGSVKDTWTSMFPGNSFAIILFQMLIFGLLISLTYRIFKGGGGSHSTPEYH